MVTIEEFITAVFCCVDDFLKEITQGQPIREKGFAPALADSEVMTMEIVTEYQGIDTDEAIWKYFRRHWLSLFPKLSSRSAFVRQAANLWQYRELLQQRVTVQGVFKKSTKYWRPFQAMFSRLYIYEFMLGESGFKQT